MIKSIYIDNFKSLVDFKLDFAKFTCLVGLNGSGKSTVLQAMDFLSQLMHGNLDEWLKQRRWESADINSKLTKKSNISFEVVLEHPTWGEIIWSGSVNRITLRCTQEQVKKDSNNVLRVDDGICRIDKVLSIPEGSVRLMLGPLQFPIMFEYQGSILSQLKKNQTNSLLRFVKEYILQIRSLDLLSPELLRSQTKVSDGKLGLGGERLSAFIHESGKEAKEKLQHSLTSVYSQLESVDTRSLRSGWKQLEITERFG